MSRLRVIDPIAIALALLAPATAVAVPRSLEEVPRDPPAAHAPRENPEARSPGKRVALGSYQSIQVNVDGLGQNIVGDAANEPSIATNPTHPSNMVVVWRQFDSINSDFREAGWAYTFDKGTTWVFPGVLQNGVFRSDPVVDVDALGTFYYQSLRGIPNVDVWRSTNGGVSWLPPVAEFGGDKNWLAVDRSGGASDGFVYGVWQAGASCCGENILTRSPNRAASFETPVRVARSPFFGTMAVGAEGELFVSGVDFQGAGPSAFVVARSTNARNPAVVPTFEAAEMSLGTMIVEAPPNPGGLLGQGNVAVDRSTGPTRGYVYALLSGAGAPGTDPMDVLLSRSTDGGVTWSPAIRVNDDLSALNWQWFGALAVAPNGRLDVVWNDTRNSGVATLSQLYYAYSHDTGLTWSINVAVSPVFDSTVGWPRQNKIGDYLGIVSDATGADVAYAATFNGEQDVYYVRLFPDCNGNGVSDDAEISSGASQDCDGNHVPDACQSVPLAPCVGAGAVAHDLVLGKSPAGNLRLAWGASCHPEDDDYEVYEGALGDFTSHAARLCTTLGAQTVDLGMPGGSTYYLVVPAHGVLEGSYGKSSAGVERPQGGAACHPRVVRACASR